jgi:hypothetical protein
VLTILERQSASGVRNAARIPLIDIFHSGQFIMQSSRLSFRALLLATSALIAPPVFAQEAAQQPQQGEQQPPADQGEVIIVQGNFIPEPLQETSEVAAFLTQADLERQGDSNAADALMKLPALSVVEGRFVYVRGLGERYSSAVLNGSPLPSPEPLQRVVPLDLFPSSILSGVMVQKSYSVEYSGEFGGGVIELSTLNLPDESFLEVGTSFSANTATTFATGYTHAGGDADWLGFDDATRKIPNQLKEAWQAARRVDSTLDLHGHLTNDQELQRIGQSFTNAELNLIQYNNDIPFNGSFDLTGGVRHDFDTFSIGAIGVLGYSYDWETEDGVQQEGRIDGGVLTPKSDYNYTSTDHKIGWDGLFGVGLEIGNDHKVNWTNLVIRRTDKRSWRRFGFDELAGFMCSLRASCSCFEPAGLNQHGRHAQGWCRPLTCCSNRQRSSMGVASLQCFSLGWVTMAPRAWRRYSQRAVRYLPNRGTHV